MIDRPSSAASGPLRARFRPMVELLEARTVPAAGLTDGPVVGGVTDHSARVFARTDSAASVTVEYSASPSLTGSLVSPSVATSSGGDFTAIVSLDGLAPLTTYYYRILVNGAAQ